jgi:hypothetical protein
MQRTHVVAATTTTTPNATAFEAGPWVATDEKCSRSFIVN